MANAANASKKHAFPESGSSDTTLTPTAANPEHNGHFVSPEEIRLAAYLKWEAAGRPDGDGVEFWSEAEQELHAAE